MPAWRWRIQATALGLGFAVLAGAARPGLQGRYFAALGSGARWSIASDALTLSSDTGPVLRLREQTPTRRVK